MENITYYIKKYSWAGNLVGITLIAYFLASIFTSALALKLAAPSDVRERFVKKPQGEQPLEEKRDLGYYLVISERNIFNSQASSLADAVSSLAGPVAQSNLKVKLIGTVEGPPEFAFAVIRNETNQESDVYRIGEKILDVAPILKIERNRVIILHDGRQESLVIYEEVETGPLAQASPTSAPIAPPPPGSPSSAFRAPDVKMIAPNRFEMDKRQFDQQISNIGPLLTQARVVPNLVDGKIAGYRIFSIVPDSLYSKIGLKDGDVIQSVNGTEISTPESALQLFQKLRDERHFQINLVRDGKQESLNYNIR